MPTILRCYSQRQTNSLLCRTIEFVCKQFYILHRKPFFLQMAGSVANILDINDNDFEINLSKVPLIFNTVFPLSIVFYQFFRRFCSIGKHGELIAHISIDIFSD